MSSAIDTLCIIGVGLIGGSLAASLRQSGWCQSVIGIDTNQQALEDALDLQIIDQAYASVQDCQQVPDVVVIAVPVLRVASVFEQLAPWLTQCRAITDVGSTKQNIIEDFQHAFPQLNAHCFVPGHPIAGREQCGVKAALADLFVQRKVILTPLPGSREDSVVLVTQMWEQAGAHVEQLSAADHDQILAATSHLPHALAFALVHCLSSQSYSQEVFRYAAGGFADFTRIASSDPLVWREICLANREPLLQALEQFDLSMRQLKDSLAAGNGDELEAIFLQAKKARDTYSRH